jgi:hypothetical protein
MSAGVGSSRWTRLSAALVARSGDDTYCSLTARLLGADGAALSLVALADRPLVCVTDEVAAALEDAQFTAGDGPSVDAASAPLPVVATDLASPPDDERWPIFAPAAAELGIRGAVAVPLRVGAARLGVLTAYRRAAGRPSIETYADAVVLGALLTREIVREQAAAPFGGLALFVTDATAYRAQVHQASGMVAVQLGIGVIDAMVRLRGRAYAEGRPVGEIAAEVVARTRRFASADGGGVVE